MEPSTQQPSVSLPIVSVLELSTAHVSKATAKVLDDTLAERGQAWQENSIILDDHRGYGWWVWIATDDIEEHDAKLPEDLRKVVQFARGIGCTWVLLDQDADTIEKLPTYE